MRIACPGCTAEYDVPDTLLVAGPRTLRCARCGTEFRAELPPAEPFAVPPAEPEPVTPPPPAREEAPPAKRPAPAPEPSAHAARPAAAVDTPSVAEEAPEPPRPVPARRRQHQPIYPPLPRHAEAPDRERGAALAGWIGTLLLLVTAAWLAYAWREEVVALWPPAARLYAALGLG
jgi:predicted Zn finger-like uncharacterized protein